MCDCLSVLYGMFGCRRDCLFVYWLRWLCFSDWLCVGVCMCVKVCPRCCVIGCLFVDMFECVVVCVWLFVCCVLFVCIVLI